MNNKYTYIIGKGGGSSEGSLRYDQPQELTVEEQKQAQENLGIDLSANLKREIVESLPSTGEDNIIYMVKRAETEEQNVYDEYMYINNAWEKIGSTDVDLTGYYTKEEIDQKEQNLQDAISGKADISSLEDYYTKEEIDGKVDDIDNAIATKADQETVDGRFSSVDEYLSYLQTAVESKADVSELEYYVLKGDYEVKVDAIDNAIATKADQEEVNNRFGSVDEYLEQLHSEIEGKADDSKFEGYYTKEEIDRKDEEYYTKGETDELINSIPKHWFGTQEEYDAITVKDPNTIYHIEGGGIDVDNYYTKTEVDGMIESKANSADVYTKSEVYNKSEIDEKLDGINEILSKI